MYRPHEMDDHPIGHIAVSLGDGRILEAHGRKHTLRNGTHHYGPDPGVIDSRTLRGRFAHWYRLPYLTA